MASVRKADALPPHTATGFTPVGWLDDAFTISRPRGPQPFIIAPEDAAPVRGSAVLPRAAACYECRMRRRVLVPLDGSRAAESAVWHAAAVAGALADGMLLVQVLEPPPAQGDTLARDLDWRLLRAEANAYLRSLAGRLAAGGLDATVAVEVGGAADEIVRLARRQDVELVVMAAHGRGEAEAFAFGGTTHKVLSLAPTSVMVVRRGEETAPLTPPIDYRHILVPLDGSPASEWALGLATALARHHQAALLLLHLVAQAPPAWENLPRSDEETALLQRLEALQHERAERYLRTLEERLAHTDLRVSSHLGQAAQLAEGIRSVADERGVDLITLAAHGASGAPYTYGTVAHRLLTVSGLPVIVFQDAPATPDDAIGRPPAEGGEDASANEPPAGDPVGR